MYDLTAEVEVMVEREDGVGLAVSEVAKDQTQELIYFTKAVTLQLGRGGCAFKNSSNAV